MTDITGTVIGVNGTAYGWMTDAEGQRVVAALDASGRIRPGWPFRPSGWSDGTLVAAPDGSLLVGVLRVGGTGFVLHRVDADGRELPGWPFAIGDATYCEGLLAATDRTIAIGCNRADGSALAITRLDAFGRVMSGWPQTLEGAESLGGRWGAGLQIGSDGTIYALGIPSDPAARAQLWVIAADGTRPSGFPVTLAAHAAGFRVVTPDRILVGSYVAPATPTDGLCSEASETIFSELDGDGRPVPGWPITAPGSTSAPVIWSDGTIHYVTRDQLVARGPDGSLRPGWPVVIPPVYPECGDQGPYLGPDGTVYVMADGLRAFGRDGRARQGWPFRPADGFAGWSCEADSIGTTSPAFGTRGTVYAAVLGPHPDPEQPGRLEVTAVDATGRQVPGWPYALAAAGPGQVDRLVAVGEHLYVAAQQCGVSDSRSVLLALDADGTLSD